MGDPAERAELDAVADAAANTLWRRNPKLSARAVLSTGQKVGFAIALVLVVVAAVLWPATTLGIAFGVASLVFLVATAFKLIVTLAGADYDSVDRIGQDEVAALRDEDLPVYTVLVPVFREANIVSQLIGNLGGLDYPTEKLEVLILVEEDDAETRDAVLASEPPEHFRIVTIPRGIPQTKPRACNVGLMVATGELLVIYDAEDEPEPDQLKKAVVAFGKGDPRTVILQASLNYFNADENALTRMFTLEYSFWFYYMLAGLEALDLPIPLGGTSNHFRTSALRDLGGWDPYNVTEDADLGIRAAALGARVGTVDSTTMEEANTSIPNFVRQRSRWIKGYMQTSLVHARQPVALIRQIGWRSSIAFVLLIAGTPATFLLVIPFTALLIATLVYPPLVSEGVLPVWATWVALVNFLAGSGLMVYVNMIGPYKRGDFRLIAWAMLNPIYWILHSVASYKALWQLIVRPHYWEKTAHGLTKQTHA